MYVEETMAFNNNRSYKRFGRAEGQRGGDGRSDRNRRRRRVTDTHRVITGYLLSRLSVCVCV